VLEAFVRNGEDGEECRHLDGDVFNNRLTNLVWGTKAENEADKIKHGTRVRGESSPLAKLTDAIVRSIREMYTNGEKQKNIAAKFGITQTTVSDIVVRKSWKHVQ
jgi:predicted XRE-type DNA-binding protein